MAARQAQATPSHIHELRQSAGQAAEATRHLASDAVRFAGESLDEARAQVRRSVTQGTDSASRLIAGQPVKSVLIAAAAGAAVAALALSLTARRH